MNSDRGYNSIARLELGVSVQHQIAKFGKPLGHEISHSFDNGGALFDAQGALRNWWTPADFNKFTAAGDASWAEIRKKCLVGSQAAFLSKKKIAA